MVAKTIVWSTFSLCMLSGIKMSWISMNMGGLSARQGLLNFGHCLTVIKVLWSQQEGTVHIQSVLLNVEGQPSLPNCKVSIGKYTSSIILLRATPCI